MTLVDLSLRLRTLAADVGRAATAAGPHRDTFSILAGALVRMAVWVDDLEKTQRAERTLSE